MYLEEQCEAHNEGRGRDEVALAANHERAGAQVLTGRRRLRHLVRLHPVGAVSRQAKQHKEETFRIQIHIHAHPTCIIP